MLQLHDGKTAAYDIFSLYEENEFIKHQRVKRRHNLVYPLYYLIRSENGQWTDNLWMKMRRDSVWMTDVYTKMYIPTLKLLWIYTLYCLILEKIKRSKLNTHVSECSDAPRHCWSHVSLT